MSDSLDKKGLPSDKSVESASQNFADCEAQLLDIKRLFDEAVAGTRNKVTEARLARRLARDKKKPVTEVGTIAHHVFVEGLAIEPRHHQIAKDRVIVSRAQVIHRLHAVGGDIHLANSQTSALR